MPPTIARLHAVSRTDQLTEYLRQHSTVNVLDLRPALREAMASDETVIVDVATDIDCRAPAPWLPEGM